MIFFHVFFSEDHVFFTPTRIAFELPNLTCQKDLGTYMEGVIPKVVTLLGTIISHRGNREMIFKSTFKTGYVSFQEGKMSEHVPKSQFCRVVLHYSNTCVFQRDGEISSCRHVASGNLSLSDDEYPYLGHLGQTSICFRWFSTRFFFPHRVFEPPIPLPPPGMWKTQLLRQQSQGPGWVVGHGTLKRPIR